MGTARRSDRLSAGERNEWRQMLSKPFRDKITALQLASRDTLTKLEEKSKKEARATSGVVDELDSIDKLEQELEKYEETYQEKLRKLQDERETYTAERSKQLDELKLKTYSKLADVSLSKARKMNEWNRASLIDQRLRTKANEIYNSLCNALPVTKQIEDLRKEQDRVEAAVLLATGPEEMRALWARVDQLFNVGSPIERAAAGIPEAPEPEAKPTKATKQKK